MRILSRLLITASLALLAPRAAHAQDSRADKWQGVGIGTRAASQNALALTVGQQAKVDSIQKRHEPELKALAESMRLGGDGAAVMKKAMELRDRTSLEIRSILTPQQRTIFDANYNMMKRQMEAMQRQMPPA